MLGPISRFISFLLVSFFYYYLLKVRVDKKLGGSLGGWDVGKGFSNPLHIMTCISTMLNGIKPHNVEKLEILGQLMIFI